MSQSGSNLTTSPKAAPYTVGDMDQQGPVVLALRDPAASDRRYPIGKLWVNTSGNTSFQLTSVSGGVANWEQLGLQAGTSVTISGDFTSTAGNFIADAGNFEAVLGDFIADAGDITATLGDITASAGAVSAGTTVTAGTGFSVVEAGGGADTMGIATLVTGAKVVATSAVTANSRIFLTCQVLGTVTDPQPLAVTARSAGVSFTITSADGTDTSQVAWLIVEPS